MEQANILEAPAIVQRGSNSWLKDWLKPPGLQGEALRKVQRKRLFAALGGAVAAAAIGYGSWYYLVGMYYVSTDDAYVDATVAEITPRVAGTLAQVPVNDTQHVQAGQVLAVIDPSDAQIALAQANANLAEATRKIEQAFANAAAAKAVVEAKAADLARARVDYTRRIALAKTGAVSADELTTVQNVFETAKAGLAAAQKQQAAAEAIIAGTDVAHNPAVLAAKATRDRARLDLERTVIRAPFAGVVAQDNAQIGQHVQVGQSLMTVVPVSQAYVNANFKESQLARVHIGQTVELTSDLYGSGVVFHGRVAGVGGGTGSAFAIIPAQNATGNWIKVVQRLPVRVALDPQELAAHPLRVGLSMTATIDTTH